MPGGYHDIYVLAPERSAKAAYRFLAAFAPYGVESAEDYCFPEFADEHDVVFPNAVEAIAYCDVHPSAAHRFYFSNPTGNPAHAMLFFTSDDGLILGLSVVGGEEDALMQLKKHAGSDIGYITFESPPCETAAEFRRVAETLLSMYRSARDSDQYA